MVTTEQTRYERIALAHSRHPGDLAAQFASAAATARTDILALDDHQLAIRDVAAGVAAPALIGFVIWTLHEAQRRKLERLCFLSRDGQVLHELATRLAPRCGIDIDLSYVYSSRVTWSLAATNPDQLSSAPWLFSSFMKSNAADLCARLGIPLDDYRSTLDKAGVSLDPDQRADSPAQMSAFQRFLESDNVRDAATARITAMRQLLLDYATQNNLAESTTGLVDAGWTGRMVGSLITVCEAAGMARPHVLLWGHEPRPTGWTDPAHVVAYMYNTATGMGLNHRVPDVPFIVETFCMGDHGIVSGYHRAPSGHVYATFSSDTNTPAKDWGIDYYRYVLYHSCDATTGSLDDVRPMIHEAMDAFWCHPTTNEARVWGSYPYDSDPAGTGARVLARPLSDDEARGDRAWLAGSLALGPGL